MRDTILLLILFISATGFSQGRVTGKIINSFGESLPGASIIIKDGEGAIIAYTTSADNGAYSVSVNNGSYQIEVNFLGYEKQNLPIKIAGDNKQIQDFKLNLSTQELKEIQIEYENPIKLHGDTLVFNAKSFTNGTETVVEDLLKNIPGITVQSDGVIRYNNRPIEKVMVEGDDFFNKGYSLLTKNMPNKPIDKVEVLQNYSNNKLLKGIEDSNSVALNLTLDDGYKNLWFGTAEIGYGDRSRYLANGSLMNFAKQYKTFLTTSFNNAGLDKIGNPDEMVTNSTDLESIGHGFRAAQVMNLGFKVPSIDEGRARFNNAKMATISTILPVGNKAKFKLLGFVGLDERRTYQNLYSVIDVDGTYFENNEINNSRNKIKRSYINAVLNYDLSAAQMFQSSTTLNTGDSNFQNDYTFNGTSTLERLKTINTYFDQKATYTYKWHDRNVVLLKARFFSDRLPQKYGINDYLLGDLFTYDNISAISNDIKSQKEYGGFQADFRLKQKNNDLINFAVGFDQNNDKLSNSFTLLTDEGNIAPEGYQSKTMYGVGDLYAYTGYTFKFNDFSFGGNVDIHQLFNRLQDNQGVKLSQNSFFVNPTLNASWQIKPDNVLSAMYSYNVSNSSLQQVNNNYLLISSRSFMKGLGYFNQWESSSANLRFMRKHYLNRYQFSVNLDYSTQNDVIGYSSQLSQNASLSTAFVIKGGKRLGARFNSHYVIKKLGGIIKLDGAVGNFVYYNQVNNSGLRKNTLHHQSFTLGWASNLKLAFNFDLATEWKFSQIESDFTFKNTTKFSYLNLKYVFSENFKVKLRTEHYNFGGIDKYNNYFFADIDALYSFAKDKYAIGLDGRNLINTNTFTTYSISDIGYSTNSYRLLPRYVLLTFKFRF